MKTVAEIFGRGMYPMSPDEQMYGIEIEVEAATDFPDTFGTGWQTTEDGSLRNDGMEFITVPLNKVHTGEAIEKYYNWHDYYGYQSSHRTGIHVHADMRSRTLPEVTGILATYAAIEPVLYRYCGEDREQNIYCIPWYRAVTEAFAWSRLIRMSSYRDIRYNMCKYSGLYLEPLQRFGTIEFRMAPTWAEPEQLYYWVEMIDRIIAYGVRGADEVVAEITSMGEAAWCEKVLGTEVLGHIARWCGGVDAEALMDNADSVSVAEMLATPDAFWRLPAQQEAGGELGYWESRQQASSRYSMLVRDEHDFDYDDEPEEY